MLVLSRKLLEPIYVFPPGSPPVVICPVRVRADKVRLGIEASEETLVLRGELLTPELVAAHAAMLAGGSRAEWLEAVAANAAAAEAELAAAERGDDADAA